MDQPRHLCSCCGGSDHVEVGANRLRCVDCGLESSFARLVALSRPGPSDPAAPDPAAPPELAWLMAEMDRRDDRFADVPFSPFALDARWTGLRSFGGWGGSDGETDHLALADGDPTDPNVGSVRVDTHRATNADATRFVLTRELIHHLWQATGALSADVRAAAFPREPVADADPTAAWADASLTVEGRVVPAKVLADGDVWIALAEAGERFVGITAWKWPLADTGLVPVTDFAVYAEGSRTLEANLRARHNQGEGR